MKHSRGLKGNLFPLQSSSGSEGAFQGYQLGPAAGRKAMRGCGAWGARVAVPAGCGGSALLSESHPSDLQRCTARQQCDLGVQLL